MQAKANQDIRDLMKKKKVCAWQCAEYMGIHENSLFRRLRRELTEAEKTQIHAAIEQLSQSGIKD